MNVSSRMKPPSFWIFFSIWTGVTSAFAIGNHNGVSTFFFFSSQQQGILVPRIKKGGEEMRSSSHHRHTRKLSLQATTEEEGSMMTSESASASSYVRCSKCTASYEITKDMLGNKGRRVSCGVCGHSWFQSNDKLFELREDSEFVPYPTEDIEKVKSSLQAGGRNDPSVFTGESKLYVGNLSYDVTDEDLIWFFSQNAGDVGDVSIITDRETGRSRGFAFVTMLSEDGGDKGVEMDGAEFMGRNLQVRRPNQQ